MFDRPVTLSEFSTFLVVILLLLLLLLLFVVLATLFLVYTSLKQQYFWYAWNVLGEYHSLLRHAQVEGISLVFIEAVEASGRFWPFCMRRWRFWPLLRFVCVTAT